MNWDSTVIKNLFDLYSASEEVSSDVSILHTDSFKIIYSKNSCWPNIVYDLDKNNFNENSLAILCKLLVEKKFHSLIIGPDSNELIKLLRTSYILPINQWLCMYKELDKYRSLLFYEDAYTIIKMDTPDDITEWVNLVEESLFNGNKLNAAIFKNLMQANKVTLIAIRNDEKIIGATMIYWGEQHSAGIYMLCTKKEFRGRGVGKILLDYSFKEILNSKGKFCVLQSTNEAIILYDKMGFTKRDTINLYWKVK